MDECDRRFTAYYQKVGRAYGMDDLASTLFAILFISPEPLAIEDLARETGYSLASVSIKARMLEQMGVITRMKRAGSRKLYLYAEKDVLQMTARIFEQMREGEVRLAATDLPAIIAALERQPLTGPEREKTKIMRTYQKDMQVFGSLVSDFLSRLKTVRMRPSSDSLGGRPVFED
jgi:DNA-binding transcriptional regulator GbsR (MarR family)